MIKNIREEDFENEVLKSGKLCIVDFYATWCGPCQMLSPVIEEVSKLDSFKEVGFFKVDIDGNDNLAIKYDVEVVPTIVFFKDGKNIKQEVGYKNKEELVKTIEKAKLS